MTSKSIATTIAVIAGALVFWTAASLLLQAAEPWDSPYYLATLSLALLLIAAVSYMVPQRAWLWGIIGVFAQLPVIAVQSGAGPLWVVGAVILLVECLTGVLSALAGAWLRQRLS